MDIVSGKNLESIKTSWRIEKIHDMQIGIDEAFGRYFLRLGEGIM